MEFPSFKLFDDALSSKSLPNVKKLYTKLSIDHPDAIELIKTHLELQIRSQTFELSKNGTEKDVQNFIEFVVSLAKEDLCVKPLTVTVLQDIFDVSSKQKCEEFFVVVENTISTWKMPFFFDACKNSVLRMCNDLLKRLSQTVDTSFCGRILILLAKALPLNERSGLNLMSQINTNNVTSYDEDVEIREDKAENEEDVDMEVGEIREQKDLNIDYDLYVKFWKLQSFFVSPTQAYNPDKWLPFESDLTDVLSIFSTYKLEKIRDEENNKQFNTTPLLNGNGVKKSHPVEEFNSFSAKYLTNQKLFHLQIADSQFRRYFLTQCLIFTNYLLNPSIKSRDPTLFMSSLQEKTVNGWNEKCRQLLKESYPNGARFADSLEAIIKNDKLWSDWKNDGCPDLVAEIQPSKLMTYKRKELEPYDPKVVDLGNPELTRLWNIDTNNLNACKSQNRVFSKGLDDILEEVLDEFDPDQQVEEQYMKCNDEKFQWTCSRHLLYNNYQHFTTASIPSDPQNKDEIVTPCYQLRNALLNAANDTTYKERAIEIKNKLAMIQKKTEQAALELAKKEKEEHEREKEKERQAALELAEKEKKEHDREKEKQAALELAEKGKKSQQVPLELAEKGKKSQQVPLELAEKGKKSQQVPLELSEKGKKSQQVPLELAEKGKKDKSASPEKDRIKFPTDKSKRSDEKEKKGLNEDRKRKHREIRSHDHHEKDKKSSNDDRKHRDIRSHHHHERSSSRKKYDDSK